MPHWEINHQVKTDLPQKPRQPPGFFLGHRLCHGDDELRVVDRGFDGHVELVTPVEFPAHRCESISTIATDIRNVRKITVSSLMDDLNFLAFIVSFFMPALVVAGFVAPTETFPVVRLVKSPGNGFVAILVVATPAFRGLRGTHAWGGVI
jgi:hypothetical protein